MTEAQKIDHLRQQNMIPFTIIGWFSEFDDDLQAEVILQDEFGMYNATIQAIDIKDESTYKVINIDSGAEDDIEN